MSRHSCALGELATAWSTLRIVEDEAVIAFDLHSMLAEAGALVVGPARTLRAAELLAASNGLAAAILDVRIGSKTTFPLARQLVQRGIPFAFHTGDAAGTLAAEWPHAQVLVKPAGREVIMSTVVRLVERQP
jgi:DNA-binding NtrC family response regulator